MLNVSDMISPAGTKASTQAAWETYEQEALALLETRFISVTRNLDVAQLKALISHSHRAAKTLGFVSSADHLQYLVAVMFWGSFFASDPQLKADLQAAGWADRKPARPSLVRLADRIDLYARQTMDDLASYKRLLETIGYVVRIAPERPSLEQVCEACANAWPARAQRLGQRALAECVALAGQRAHSLGLTGPDLVLYCVMSLYFGQGFDCDPLYPWASAAFAIDDDPAQRRLALLAGMRRFFDARGGHDHV